MGWVQQDATGLMLRRIRKFTDMPERIVAVLPKGWTPSQGAFVTVTSDGTPISHKSWTRESIRITVHAPDGPTARRLMAAIDGHLLQPMGQAPWAFSIRASTGLIVTKDSRVGGWVASAVYSVGLNRKVFS